jgi:hypothetical protein
MLYNKKLGKHEYITVKIGDNRPFNTTFPNLNSLLNYMHAWQPKDAIKYPNSDWAKKENMISHISIVKIFDKSRGVKKHAKKGKKKGSSN